MKIDVSSDIHSLTEFKTKTLSYQKQLKQVGRAMLLTVNGHAELAVMSAATFQRVLESLDALDALRGIREGMNQIKAGHGRPLADVSAAVRKKQKIRSDR